MAKAFFLSEADVTLLRQMVEREKRGQRNTQNRPGPDVEDYPSADVYIAKTPGTGIPALNDQGTTGTGSVASEDDVPGKADCQVYQIITTAGTPKVKKVPGLIKTVYNLSDVAIPKNQLMSISKDKFGSWIVGVPLDFAQCP